MEVNVYNIKGEDTGKKVTLNDSVFGIEPNDHVIYLAVKHYLAAQRQGTAKSKERSEISGSASSAVKKEVEEPVEVISILRCWWEEPACLVPNPAIIVSS